MRKIIENMRALGLSVKKQLAILAFFDFLLMAIIGIVIYTTKNFLYIGMGLFFVGLFSYFYLTRYKSKIEKNNSNNIEEFAILFNYFKIYVHNGYSVYASLKEIQLFANEDLKNLLQKLLNEIDEDKSVQPFINFSSNFNDIIVEEMMISIYQMIDDGEQSNYLTQFELIFDKFSETLYQKNLRAKDSKLGTLSSSPLIGSCFLIVVLTIGIVNAIGVMINGL